MISPLLDVLTTRGTLGSGLGVMHRSRKLVVRFSFAIYVTAMGFIVRLEIVAAEALRRFLLTFRSQLNERT